MSRTFRRAYPLLGVALAGVVCSGCGPGLYETASVSGTVTCNGKPAVGGWVVFKPVDAPDKTGRPKGEQGRISRGMVGEDGSFTLKLDPRGADDDTEGAVVGPHEIAFIPPRTVPAEMDPSDAGLPPEEQEYIKAELAKVPVFKPLECGPEGITPTELEVAPGSNEFEFTLKPGGGGARPAPRQGYSGSD